MDFKKEFNQILESTNEIALATSVDGIPNVRIVNFCYDQNKSKEGVLYFCSDRENRKVIEFGKNNRIAFTTIAKNDSSVAHIRSNNATVQKSKYSLLEVKDLFITKIPGYDETIDAMGESLDVYEIQMEEVTVILDHENVGEVSFK